MTIASLSMVTFGIVLTLLGASLPVLIARFGIDKREAGGLLALMSFAILAASVVFGPVVDRRGYRGVLLTSFGAIIAGAELIAFAPSVGWLRVGVVLTGFAGGIVNGAGNALVADVVVEQRAAALTFVGGFFGVGAAGVPLVLALLADHWSHSATLAAVGVLVLVPVAATALGDFPPPKHPQGFPLAHARELLGDAALLLMGLILFLESGVESTVGGWITTFFAEELRISADRSPFFLALFWLGLMLTRLSLGVLLPRVTAFRALSVSLGVGFSSTLLLILSHTPTVAAGAAFLMGCGFAPMFPILYGLVGDRYPRVSGTALSVVISIALLGGMAMPYATGALGAAHGLRRSFSIVPVALSVLAMLLVALYRRIKRTAADQRRE